MTGSDPRGFDALHGYLTELAAFLEEGQCLEGLRSAELTRDIRLACLDVLEPLAQGVLWMLEATRRVEFWLPLS
ncbi:MAG TPA: hypothetical protein VMW58_00350 [Anaerolineae bacterium]|nr:hypothetical protein [Anaerolineae bacterium]